MGAVCNEIECFVLMGNKEQKINQNEKKNERMNDRQIGNDVIFGHE